MRWKKLLFAADELSGLIWAASADASFQKYKDMELNSLMKKYKSKGFAADAPEKSSSAEPISSAGKLEKLLTMTMEAMKATEDD